MFCYWNSRLPTHHTPGLQDLAARNVLVDRDETTKVADFGLSREVVEDEYKVTKVESTELTLYALCLIAELTLYALYLSLAELTLYALYLIGSVQLICTNSALYTTCVFFLCVLTVVSVNACK